ncbi:SGNH/GDSL hydrolase family protein [Alteromonas sediminis]|uniref:SGNH/GDSL hydrolase family protein n=1 Tax=Alteromonas sediminis TaxID=2259342 RepID=A0A3N5XXT4_9ALTE|nr:SGNH/GDSL hydrolase family protein [Alteromonas sediminis]RPJ65877.1 SGNH/GDSL hydrolase family protein [Alteromonas sediminis]
MWIYKILLGPLLLVQGRWVRKNIIRLAEPDGPRQGVNGSGPELRVLVLGDSAAAGVGVAQQDEALAGQLVKRLSDSFLVKWQLVAKTGENTDSIIPLLDSELAPDARFDLVLISLGVNDVTANKHCNVFIAQTNRLITVLKTRYQAKRIVFSGIPPMGHFPALPQPLRWYLGRIGQQFDNALKTLTKEQGFGYLPQDQDISPALMATDGFHPSALLYQKWATEAARHVVVNRKAR